MALLRNDSEKNHSKNRKEVDCETETGEGHYRCSLVFEVPESLSQSLRMFLMLTRYSSPVVRCRFT